MEDLPKSRKEAVKVGSSYYFNGNPCVHGHVSRRFTRTWECYECKKERTKNSGKKRYKRHMAKFGKGYEHSTPPWVSQKDVYTAWNKCPKGYHVDHIVPRDHVLVCGLNSPENMEFVEPGWNFMKGSRFWPDMPEYDWDFMKWIYNSGWWDIHNT